MLLRLLALPITGPIKGTVWVIEQILAAAQAELEDASAQEAVSEARAAYERGEIGFEELSARVDALLDEMLLSRAVDEPQG